MTPPDDASRSDTAPAGRPVFLATFDIEDWFHAENVRVTLGRVDLDALPPRLEPNAHELLDILAETGVRATCFVVGWVAQRYPAIVRRIVDEGHEIASHTHLHRNLHGLSPGEVIQELATAKDVLEQTSGQPVRGVRAPNFSISDAVLDVLAEGGYWYDSSYFGFQQHDRYGRLSAPPDPAQPVVEVRPGLLELQMTRLPVGPSMLPWAGGAYFRLIPYPLYRAGVARHLRTAGWFTFYLHPWELDVDEVPPEGMRRQLKIRSYSGRSRMRRDLRRLLTEFGSLRIDEALRARGHLPPDER